MNVENRPRTVALNANGKRIYGREGAPVRLLAHPFADMFPLADEDTLDALAEDIRANGLRDPIVTLDNQILDGRNRMEACARSHETPMFVRFDEIAKGDDPLAWVISRNLHRRQLTASQRAMVAARLPGVREAAQARQEAGRARSAVGNDAEHAPAVESPRKASEDAARVGARVVEHARRVIDHGTPELAAAVERGNLPVTVASDLARLTPEQQREAIAAADPEIVRKVARDAKKRDQQKAATERREKALAREGAEGDLRERALPGIDLRLADVGDAVRDGSVKGAQLIHADPPWEYSNNSVNGAADKHYDCPLTMGDIVGHLRDAYEDAAPNAYMLVWCTSPMLAPFLQAVGLAELQGAPLRPSWRWDYITALCWVKDGGIGIGFHARGDHEHVLVFGRGRPKPTSAPRSVHVGPRTRHSEKPEAWLVDLVRAYTEPGALVVDLYAGLAPLARACATASRRYVGVEIDPVRHAEALERLRPPTPLLEAGK